MAFLTGNTYNLNVYLTKKGINALTNGGLKDKITKFSLFDSNSDYSIYTDTTYKYDGSSDGLYLDTTGGTVNVPTKNITDLAGNKNKKYSKKGNKLTSKFLKDDNGNYITKNGVKITPYNSDFEFTENITKRVNLSGLKDIVLYNPDLQTTVDYDLLAYKVSNKDKYFDLSATNQNRTPIVLGGRNMWRDGLDKNRYLTFEDVDSIGQAAYIDFEEPVYGNTFNSGNTRGYPGVSVTNQRLSKTEFQSFYVFNKSRFTMYFDSIQLSNVKPIGHTVKNIKREKIANSTKVKDTYTIQWKALNGITYIEGMLYLIYDSKLLDINNKLLLPFENYEFFVGYEVYRPGSKITHYRGQTIGDNKVKEGKLEFQLEFKAYNDRVERNSDNIFTETIDIIVQTKDSGFDSNTYNNSGNTTTQNATFERDVNLTIR